MINVLIGRLREGRYESDSNIHAYRRNSLGPENWALCRGDISDNLDKFVCIESLPYNCYFHVPEQRISILRIYNNEEEEED